MISPSRETKVLGARFPKDSTETPKWENSLMSPITPWQCNHVQYMQYTPVSKKPRPALHQADTVCRRPITLRYLLRASSDDDLIN